MNKSILVIDTPKSCKTCPISNRYFHECPLVKRGLYDEERKGIRHENCPLKDLPKQAICYPAQQEPYWDGWNDCLDEILGGEE